MSAQPIPFAPRRKIRVFIVDDSVVVRRLLTRALTLDATFEVVGAASSAESALQRLPLLNPDVMTLDIHMSGMSGLDLLPIVRERFPQLRVLIFSSSSAASAAITVDALLKGATGFLLKPSADETLEASLHNLHHQLSQHIHQLFHPNHPITPPPAKLAALGPQLIRTTNTRREILAIGVSTGGPTALAKVIAGLPHNFHLPVVIVQHMPPVFTQLLATRIRTSTGFHIVEGEDGMLVEPGKAILAPGDFHMRLVRTSTGIRIALDQGPQECSCRPAVDVLFRSVAELYGRAAIATVLTGMGQDGLRGATELARLGACILAQDEASSVVWGMPGAIAQANLAHEILPLDAIAAAILHHAGRR